MFLFIFIIKKGGRLDYEDCRCRYGYVGLSIAVLLSQKHEVVAYDILPEKVDMINHRILPIKDAEMETYFQEKELHLRATNDAQEAYRDADYIVIATPTNYDDQQDHFDTSAVESVIEEALAYNRHGSIVIKSTIPVGYVKKVREKYQTQRILFSPEFLREGKALYDNLYPSRIVVGEQSEEARIFAELLKESTCVKDVPVLLTQPTEAEAIKLFANTYLAMRVAFFNEIDTYCEINQLNTQQIIHGIGLDPRIGNHYNNPSFGYGGYCLPKDTKQLKANFAGVPNNIITAVVDANDTRKHHIANRILQKHPKTIGIYRLTMKKDSDNYRKSAIFDVIELLREHADILIYEPTMQESKLHGLPLERDLERFKAMSDVIVVNRLDEKLQDVKEKVYTRDIYGRDE